ncbi:hypothetical protein [Metasolibacillus sp.]|uniref:hypothetical protein n=1 Tax=Metasolibacillus sp. TaxID=2703680 RepID=UPI0025D71147|nr:hypothetical protein [Metasolibacillus sp.]MCT6923478.1 hypothetical protein [Metasolibacillus sp.]MCT6939800.1 hypothetical protein [Metasolibacillus sp.]
MLLKRFAFWLPVLAVVNYIFELIVNPIKDVGLAVDPLLSFILMNMGNITYDHENFKLLFPGFLIHFSLWLLYGVLIDKFIKQLI